MKTKILILSSNPDPMRLLRADREIKKIKRIHRQHPNRQQFELIFEPAVSFNNFIEDIEEYKPDILHFICHTSESKRFLFEPEDDAHSKAPQIVASTKVAQAIQRVHKSHTIKTIFLNTCYSDKIAEHLAQLPPTIAEVIGIAGEIYDDEAILLSGYFYQAFFDTKNTKDSFNAAKIALRNHLLRQARPKRDIGAEETPNPNTPKPAYEIMKLYINGRKVRSV
jgi:CHAT domain